MRINGTKNRSAKEKKEAALPSFFKTFGKWSVTIFFSIWMFILGIMVGREAVPIKFDIEKLQKELGILKKTSIEEERRQFNMDKESLCKTPPIFDYADKLRSIGNENKQQEFSQESAQEEKESSEKEDNPTKSAISLKTVLIEKTAARKKKNEKQIEIEEVSPDAETDSYYEDGLDKNITLQLASFRNPSDAERMVTELKEKGYQAYVASADVPEKGTFYRVRIGFFRTKSEGRDLKERLRADNFISFFITRK